MAPENLPPVLRPFIPRRRSWFNKSLCVGVLILVLQIPLLLTQNVVRERERYRDQATAEISTVWGGEQRIIGPVLAVPYSYRTTVTRLRSANATIAEVDETKLCNAVAYFTPTTLLVDGAAEPQLRHRGIYDSVVYTARLKFSGTVHPDLAAAGIAADHVDWAKAQLLFGCSDLHGLRSISPLHTGRGTDATFEPVEAAAAEGPQPLGAVVAGLTGPAEVTFNFEAVVQGSSQLSVTPAASDTQVKLTSPWTLPSFVGRWLPTEYHLGKAGFDAMWTIPYFSRTLPKSWSSREVPPEKAMKTMEQGEFGVRFIRGIDGYAMVERAHKYGILFIAITFAVFFLFEVTTAIQIHPMQYAMVGAALCLFFLAFLALTEFWSAGWAYTAAAGACTGLVAAYAFTFLRSGPRTLVVLGGMTATYGCLYFVLKSQDYALVAGTGALFAVLATAMFFTRNLDWYAPEPKPVESGS